MTDDKAANARTAKNDPGQIAKIESEIDQTRDAITGDLRTLGERLSPENLKQEAREVMTEAKHVAVETLHEAKNVATNTFREVKQDALETVHEKVDELRDGVRYVEQEAVGFARRNAVPLALIGVGIAWFMQNQRSRDRRWEGEYAPRGHGQWRYPQRSDGGTLDETRDGLARARDNTREYAQRAGERARGWAGDAENGIQNAAGRVRSFAQQELDEARRLARDARHEVSGAAQRARELTQRELGRARQLSRNAAEMHPLALGAAAVAGGVCLGLLLPETRRESELLGPQRDRLMSGAREAVSGAKEALDDLQHTAKQTGRELKDSLGGLTG